MQKMTIIAFVTISLLPAAAVAQAAQTGLAADGAAAPFRAEEATVLAGLPALKRKTNSEFAAAFTFENEDVKDPWDVYISKDQVQLLWSTNGVDDQTVFTFDQAIAVVSKNVCGAVLKLNYKQKKGRVEACRYAWTVEGERWMTTTVVLSPGDQPPLRPTRKPGAGWRWQR
jgi:hypothetical protein